MPDFEDMVRDMRGRLDRTQAALLALSQTYAGRIEGHMKREASWGDRSSNARNRLFARAEVFPPPRSGTYSIGIRGGHGMEYGVYLELGTRFMKTPPTTGIGSPSVVASTGLVGYPIVEPTMNPNRAGSLGAEYVQAARDLIRSASGG